MNSDSLELPIAPDASGSDSLDFQVCTAFSVRDDETANWLVRRIVAARAYAERCEAFAARERRRAAQEEAFLLGKFGAQLREYATRKLIEQGGRRKSVNFPAGTVGYRTQPEKIVVDDEAAVITWAREHNPTLVSTIEKLKKAELNDYVKKTGEVPALGVHIESAHDEFYIR